MPTKEIKGLDYINNIEEAENIQKVLYELKDRIKYSSEYLLLYGKTQMFYDDKGRSRGGHSYNIGETSKSIVSKTFKKVYSDKRIENSDLYDFNLEIYELYAEIIGLSHDLGHTPLGHDGENVLNKKLFQMTKEDESLRQQVLKERQELFSGITMTIDQETADKIKKKDKIDIEPGTYKYEDFQEEKRKQKGELGIGFEHNEYSAQIFSRIFDELSQELAGTEYEKGMEKLDKNRFMTAILAHSRSRFPAIPEDYLAQVVRQSDKVEYMNYDFEEYAEMGCFPLEKTENNEIEYDNFNKILEERAKETKVSGQELKDYMKLTGEERREDLEDGMVKEALEQKGKIDDNMKAMKMSKICAEFKDDTLFYVDENGKRGLITGNNVEREETIINKITDYYKSNPDRIPKSEIRTAISPLNKNEISNVEVVAFSPERVHENQYEQLKAYIGSLTNEKCEELYQQLVQERIQEGERHEITLVAQSEINKKLNHWKAKSNVPNKKTGKTIQEKSAETYSYLPQNIKDMINKNQELHREQVGKDEVLYQEMLDADRKRETEKIAEMHDQKSDQFFEDIEIGKFNITDFQKLSETRRKETVAKVTSETIQGVRNNEQTKGNYQVGDER